MKKQTIILLAFSLLLSSCSVESENIPDDLSQEAIVVEPVTVEGIIAEQDVTPKEPIVVENTTSKQPATPVQALTEEHLLLFGKDGMQPLRAELVIERIDTDAPGGLPVLRVTIVEDGLPDDAVKQTEREVYLQRHQDSGWEVTNQELLDFECYREQTDDGCL